MAEPAYTYDTYDQVKEFQSVGFKEKEANAIVKAILRFRDHDSDKLATKEQVAAIEHKLDQIDQRMDQMDQRMDQMDQRMDQFATKEQVSAIEQRLGQMDQRMDQFATKDQLIAEIANAKTSIIQWMIAIMLTFTGIIGTAIFTLIKFLAH